MRVRYCGNTQPPKSKFWNFRALAGADRTQTRPVSLLDPLANAGTRQHRMVYVMSVF